MTVVAAYAEGTLPTIEEIINLYLYGQLKVRWGASEAARKWRGKNMTSINQG